MIGVLHAYSRTNPGDGLLLDITVDRLERAGIAPEDVLVLALDPESFDGPYEVRKVGVPGRGASVGLLPAATTAAAMTASAVLGRPLDSRSRALANCEALVGVGGGFIRSVDMATSVGTFLNHYPQLVAAAAGKQPSLYLPQTIGPLRGPVGRLVKRGLAGVGTVCVRDQWSYDELAAADVNVRRVPDLVILRIAERWDGLPEAPPDQRVGIVASNIPHAAGYEAHLQKLADVLGERAVWVSHKEGDHTKSDGVHLQRLGLPVGGRLLDMLEKRELSAVISVRLHAALMALESGIPAIHLAYDRKGPAAFADLGIEDWCFDIRSLSPVELEQALSKILDDQEAYWERVAERVPTLRDASAELDDLVKGACA